MVGNFHGVQIFVDFMCSAIHILGMVRVDTPKNIYKLMKLSELAKPQKVYAQKLQTIRYTIRIPVQYKKINQGTVGS